jgi:uncharacterized protein (DUF433 family)
MPPHECISIDPAVMVGKPVISGTRITVELIVQMLSDGVSVAEIVRAYPHITSEDVEAARQFAEQNQIASEQRS